MYATVLVVVVVVVMVVVGLLLLFGLVLKNIFYCMHMLIAFIALLLHSVNVISFVISFLFYRNIPVASLITDNGNMATYSS